MSLKNVTSAGLKQKQEKRGRETNFTSLQTNILVEEIQKVNSVLFGKLDQKVSSQDKQKLWQRITNRVNSAGPGTERRIDQIKKRWYDVQRGVKKKESTRRCIVRQTGNDGNPPELSDTEKIVVDLLGDDVIDGIKGGFDTAEIEKDDRSTISPANLDSQDTESQEDNFEIPEENSDSVKSPVLPQIQEEAQETESLLSETCQSEAEETGRERLHLQSRPSFARKRTISPVPSTSSTEFRKKTIKKKVETNVELTPAEKLVQIEKQRLEFDGQRLEIEKKRLEIEQKRYALELKRSGLPEENRATTEETSFIGNFDSYERPSTLTQGHHKVDVRESFATNPVHDRQATHRETQSTAATVLRESYAVLQPMDQSSDATSTSWATQHPHGWNPFVSQ